MPHALAGTHLSPDQTYSFIGVFILRQCLEPAGGTNRQSQHAGRRDNELCQTAQVAQGANLFSSKWTLAHFSSISLHPHPDCFLTDEFVIGMNNIRRFSKQITKKLLFLHCGDPVCHSSTQLFKSPLNIPGTQNTTIWKQICTDVVLFRKTKNYWRDSSGG